MVLTMFRQLPLGTALMRLLREMRVIFPCLLQKEEKTETELVIFTVKPIMSLRE